MLSRSMILDWCSEAVYRRGIVYHKSGRVENMTIQETKDLATNKENRMVSANVSGSGGKKYQVSLTLSKEEHDLLDYDCDCPYDYPGMCKHCVATALEFLNRMPPRIHKAVPQTNKSRTYTTESELANRICVYSAFRNNEIEADPVHVTCSFSGESGEMSLECKIGRKRMIIVKNILLMLKNVKYGTYYQYGTTLGFQHTLSVFDEESRAVLRELEYGAVDHYTKYINHAYISLYNTEFRNLTFSGRALERLLALYVGKTIELNQQRVQVIDGNPPVCFMLSGASGRARLTGTATRIFECGERAFVLLDNTLWYCTPQFVKQVLPLLSLFCLTERYSYQKEKAFWLSEQDYAVFYRHVLPSLKGLAEVDTENLNLSDWAPPEPQFTLYLHQPEEHTISMTATVSYGRETRDLFAAGMETSGWHDPKEEQLRQCIRQFFPEKEDRPGHFAPFDGAPWLPGMESDEVTVPIDTMQGTALFARGDDALWKLMSGGFAQLASLAELYADDSLRRIRVCPAGNVSIGISLSGGLLDMSVQMDQIDIREIEAILASYRARKKYYRLKNGDFLALGDNSLSTLAELAEGLDLSGTELSSGHAVLPASRALYVDSVLGEAQNVRFSRSAEFRRMIRGVQDYHNGEYALPVSLNAELRPYQADGFQWLCAMYELGLGGILADDMGLGKTLQMITLFLYAVEREPAFSALVIAPTSLLYNWESEVHRFAPSLSVQIIAGNAAEREDLIAQSEQYHVNITSYDLFRRSDSEYAEKCFTCLVLDEAQHVKNAATKAAKGISHLNAVHRFAMTGTPMENRLSDLWSIFNCIMPGYLYTYPVFRRQIEQPVVKLDDEVARRRLSRMVFPFLLRRRKEDVLKDLPDKLEENIYIRLSPEQEKLYRAQSMQLAYHLTHSDDETVKRERIKILAALTRLRMLCCSPSLCYQDYTGDSGKVDACLEMIRDAVNAGHRVLVFSQFTSMLELLIRSWEGDYLYLSGKDQKQARRDMVEKFQQGGVPVFFISLKAGGTGLNLTRADVVIHCDPWWNTAAQDQATDRAHRIGQKNTVNVLRVIARDTIEEKILALQARKSALADAVVSGSGTEEFTFDRDELIALLSERDQESAY